MSATVIYPSLLIPLASDDSAGIVMVRTGNGLWWDGYGALYMDVASAYSAGAVRVPQGGTVTVTEDGDVGVRVGGVGSPGVLSPDGTTIVADQDGTISAVGSGGPYLDIRTDGLGERRLAIVIPEE